MSKLSGGKSQWHLVESTAVRPTALYIPVKRLPSPRPFSDFFATVSGGGAVALDLASQVEGTSSRPKPPPKPSKVAERWPPVLPPMFSGSASPVPRRFQAAREAARVEQLLKASWSPGVAKEPLLGHNRCGSPLVASSDGPSEAAPSGRASFCEAKDETELLRLLLANLVFRLFSKNAPSTAPAAVGPVPVAPAAPAAPAALAAAAPTAARLVFVEGAFAAVGSARAAGTSSGTAGPA
mmetsp:Transcript_104435/g.265078  ORF Transcript_104435/g.265078 Transcript_104435/m.265078 type:complete len:238 (+) Transcript_104435:324-1037(+)